MKASSIGLFGKKLLFLILMGFLLGGCTQENGSESALVITGSPVGTESTQPVTQITGPVRALTAVYPDTTPAIAATGDGGVLVQWIDYDAGVTHLAVVNPETDSLVAETRLDGCWNLYSQSFSDGSFAMYDREKGLWMFYNRELQQTGSFAPENMYGFFSHDRKTYYFLQEHILCGTDVNSGEVRRIKLPYDLRFSEILAIHPYEDRLALRFFLSPYQSTCGTAYLDLAVNTYQILAEERYQLNFMEDAPCLFLFDEQQMGFDVLYKSGGRFSRADASLFENGELLGINGTSYLLGIGENTMLYGLSEGVTQCSLSDNGVTGGLRSACWLPESQMIVGGAYQQGTFQLYAIYPSALPFAETGTPETVESPLTVKLELVDAYWGEAGSVPVADTLQDARQYADRLEAKYGVRILLSNQCADPASLCGYSITTTDDMGFSNEAYEINRALVGLDRSLALYPKDFFRQFQNSMGEGGIRFLLVGFIDSGHATIGCSFKTGDWHNIAIDVRLDTFESIVCHEVWHATEDKIVSTDTDAFTRDVWSVYNPEGFAYYGDASLSDPDQNRWTLFSTGNENVYFVDSYSRVSEKEDRARIMEYVMTREEYAEALAGSPAIMQKLMQMCEAIRENFDTSQWEDVRWEQFLDE